MRIGILTFQCALNHGAVLQAYALQTYLMKTAPDATVEIINYYPSHMRKTYGYKRLITKNPVSTLLKCGNLFVRRSKFKKFLKKYISLGRVCDENNIKSVTEGYDKIIVGSDQVWNLDLTDGDLNYYLEFAPENKRYSYAASVGMGEYPEESKSRISSLLNTYRQISVREGSAIELLRGIGVEKDIECVLDPTMLLSQSDWDRLQNEKFKPEKPYVFIYTIKYAKELVDEAIRYAEENYCDIFYVGPYNNSIKPYYVHSPSIEQLITLFKHSQCSFVGSFHGTVFSLLYHKSFLVNCEYRDGRNSRIENLLSTVELREHVLNNPASLKNAVDWQSVDDKLASERTKSTNYLKRLLEDEN